MLGELEQLVLLATLRVGDDAYGVTILRELERQAGRELTLASVYKTLARLEDKGYVSSRVGEPTPQRGGRRKRHYAVTAAGRLALRRALSVLRRMARDVEIGWDVP